MKDHRQTNIPELSEEQQEFIRLLREKAADTPVPMALQPEMMMARLPERPSLWQRIRLKLPARKTVSGLAAVLAACVAVLLTGREPIQQYLTSSGPAVSAPESQAAQTESSDVSAAESSLSTDSTPSAEETVSPAKPQTTEDADEASFSEESSYESDASFVEIGDTEEWIEIIDGDDLIEIAPQPQGTSSTTATQPPSADSDTAEVTSTDSTLLPSGSVDESDPVLVDPSAQATNLPSAAGADYAEVYAALQRAVTPENASTQYTTAVLSAGISADGLVQNNQKTVSATDGTYFYVSRQNATSISILRGNETSGSEVGSIQVTFETPTFSGMDVVSTAITDCFYSNSELFVVGTISYKGSAGARTLSAVSCYDVSQPKSPRLLATSAQDGTMVGAVMSGSYLYLFSRYYPDTTVQESYPAGYIPLLYSNGLAALPSANSIAISAAGTDSYIVATSRSAKNPGDVIDCQILQGCGKSFYLGEGGLYLFQDRSSDMQTMISGITFSAGQLHVANEVTVNGILGALESPNEYGQTLRILTTSYGSTNDTNLYIFDRSLQLLGKSEKFLSDAVLRSIRFDGYTLYYTVYGFDGQVYEMNLSDPTALQRAETAEPEAEALLSVATEGNYSVRLTGRKGRTELVLTLRLTGLERDSVTIPLSSGYNEEELRLTYLKNNYICLRYQDGSNDVFRLYRCADDQLVEVLSYLCPTSENAQVYLQDGKFFLVTSMRTLSFDPETGDQLGEVGNEN